MTEILDALRRSMRIEPDSKIDLRLKKTLDKLGQTPLDLLEVDSIWRAFPNTNPEFPKGLSKFEELIFVGVTAGQPYSDLIDKYSKARKLFYVTVLDSLANIALMERENQIYQEILDWTHAQGKQVSRRYSPGCPHMSLDHLPTILNALSSTQPISISCTDAHMLVPVKSVVYVHGISRILAKDQPPDFCSTCRKTGCPRSRKLNDNPQH